MDARRYFESERLNNGSDVIVRAIQPDDKQALREGFARLSEESVYFRFFRYKRKLTERELIYFTELDFDNHVALGLAVNITGRYMPIGVGRYIVEPDQEIVSSAEFAITVADSHQELGAGSILLKHLVRIAKSHHLDSLVAHVLTHNARMIKVIRDCGMPVKQKTVSGVTELSIYINGTSDSESLTE